MTEPFNPVIEPWVAINTHLSAKDIASVEQFDKVKGHIKTFRDSAELFAQFMAMAGVPVRVVVDIDRDPR